MVDCAQPIRTLEELRSYVHQVICQREQLVPNAFPTTERLLTRKGRPCGLLFCLHGPRALRLSEIWETDNNTVLFYSSSGERFQRTRLVGGPRLALVAA